MTFQDAFTNPVDLRHQFGHLSSVSKFFLAHHISRLLQIWTYLSLVNVINTATNSYWVFYLFISATTVLMEMFVNIVVLYDINIPCEYH